MGIKLAIYLVCTLISFCMAADQGASEGGVYVKVLGQSGKIMVGRTENPAEDENRMTVEMDEIKEVDSSGNAVGTSGQTKHSYNTFASQDFTFSQLETNVNYENVTAQRFNFTTTLSGVNADLKVIVYIFKEEGNITVDGETTEVDQGTVKFNIEMGTWTWCTGSNCRKGNTDQTGEYVDFTITVKGKGTASPTTDSGVNMPKRYSLGAGADLVLSQKVDIDGTITNMPANYPMMTIQGSKQKFTFRFAKWTNGVIYDPTLDPADTSDTGGTTVLCSSIAMMFIGVLQILLFF